MPFGPKNHSKLGEDTLEGRGMGEIRVAEHLKVKKFPTTPGPEGEIVTWLASNVIPKFTSHIIMEEI